MRELLIIAGIIGAGYFLVNNLSLQLQTTSPELNNLIGLPLVYPLKDIFVKRAPGDQSIIDVSLVWNQNSLLQS